MTRDPAERLQAVRHRRSGPASGGSSRSRRPLLVLGMLLQRFEFVDHLRLPAARRRPRSPSSPTTSTSRSGPGRASRSTATAADAGRGHPRSRPRRRRPPPHRSHRHGTPLAVLFGSNLGTAEAIADPARAGGHRARLRRDPRRARRPRRRPAPRRRGARSSARPTTGLPRTTPPRSAAGSRGAADGAADGVAYTRLRLRQHRVGRDLPGGARRCSTTQLDAHGGRRDPPARRGQRRRRLRRRLPRLARRPVVRPGRARSTCRPRSARRPRPPARGCRSR